VTDERGTSGPVLLPGGVPGRGQARLEEATADLRMARDGLLGVSDPRETRAYLEAMRSCVTDITEIAGDEPDLLPSPAAAGPRGAAPAGSDVLDACGQVLDAVDLLLFGIADARRLSLRRFSRAGEAFTAGREMTRLLLADRAAVDATSRDLLRVTAGYLMQLPPAPAPGGGQDTAPPPSPSPGSWGTRPSPRRSSARGTSASSRTRSRPST
jgi:hypothetical protein